MVQVVIPVHFPFEIQESEVRVEAQGVGRVVDSLGEDPRRGELHGAGHVSEEVEVARQIRGRGFRQVVEEVAAAGQVGGRGLDADGEGRSLGCVDHVRNRDEGGRRHKELVYVPHAHVAVRGEVAQQAVRVGDVLRREEAVAEGRQKGVGLGS